MLRHCNHQTKTSTEREDPMSVPQRRDESRTPPRGLRVQLLQLGDLLSNQGGWKRRKCVQVPQMGDAGPQLLLDLVWGTIVDPEGTKWRTRPLSSTRTLWHLLCHTGSAGGTRDLTFGLTTPKDRCPLVSCPFLVIPSQNKVSLATCLFPRLVMSSQHLLLL